MTKENMRRPHTAGPQRHSHGGFTATVKPGCKRLGVFWRLGEWRGRDPQSKVIRISKVRVPRSRGCFCHSIKLGFGVRVISKAKISLGCSLVLLEMNDEFRLSNTLFDINF